MEASGVALTSALPLPDIAYINEVYNNILRLTLLFTVEGLFYQNSANSVHFAHFNYHIFPVW
jgi:hypothetical protein